MKGRGNRSDAWCCFLTRQHSLCVTSAAKRTGPRRGRGVVPGCVSGLRCHPGDGCWWKRYRGRAQAQSGGLFG